ncbi:MAG TPA: fused MFS/spermidine synthase [Vicinamibacterales bacterium]
MPLLLILFIGSGCAALIYEIVWFQLLQLVIGSSVVSLGVLLGTFMGGMCLGSLLLPRMVSSRHHPLRVYAMLEFGIGIIGLLILWGMPLIGGIYTAWAGPGVAGLFVRGLVAAICLLPPTLLMGATLPAVARWVETTPQGVSWLGFFYGGNIVGAVIGSLTAGFYLLRVYDTAVATYVAVALNVIVAGVGFGISRNVPAGTTERVTTDARPAPGAWAVYVAIGISGMTALAAEVIWTRILSLLFGATVYTFSLILAVFLVGLGIGSSLGAAIGRGLKRPRVALGICQVLLCAAIAWTAYVTTQSLPFWPINPSLAITAWFTMQLDLVLCLWAVLPAAILWGASFPLALASVASPGQDPARLVGGVYAANTVGAIIGSLAASFVLVAWIGSQHAQQVLIVASLVSALLVLAWGVLDQETMSNTAQWVTTGGLVVAGAVAVLLARTVPDVPGVLIAYGRYTATRNGQDKIIYKDEGMTASVAVSQMPNGVLNYHNAGKIQASSQPEDMRLQRMLGHLTTLLPEHATRVVVIGCGAGVTAGAVSIDPAVEYETIAEIEPLVPRVVSTYFAEHNFDVVRNPKVHIQIDDGRHYVATLRGKFDALTSDPLDPWVKGAAMLYTREFFEDVKAHLNPGGVVTLFVQLYESNTDAVKSEIGTFFEAFPNGMVFGNTNNGVGYDLVLFGQVEPTTINLDAIEARLKQPEYAKVAQSLREIGFNSAVDLFSTYAGSASDLKPWLKDAPINRDRNLRLQYLAGLGLNLYQSGPIYAEMLTYRTPPQNLFVGSDALKNAVMAGIQAAGQY